MGGGRYDALGLNSINVFSIENQMWTGSDELPEPMPTPRAYGRAVAVSEVIYVLGGCTNCFAENNDRCLSTTEALDTRTGAWTTLQPMPTARRNFAAVAKNELIYIAGGNNEQGPVTGPVEIFNVHTALWTVQEEPHIPIQVQALSAALIGSTVFVIPWADWAGRSDCFNIEVGAWTPANCSRLPLDSSFRRSAAAVVGNSVYVEGYVNHRQTLEKLTFVDECASEPCRNEGVCTHSTGSYSCSCVAGYAGENCEIAGNWHLGRLGQTCTSVCSEHGFSCTNGNWGVYDVTSVRAAITAAGEDPETLCAGTDHDFGSSRWCGAPYVHHYNGVSCNYLDLDAESSQCGGVVYPDIKPTGDSRCSESQSNVRRLCLCGD